MDPRLVEAARFGNVELLRELIDEYPNLLRQVTPKKNTALHISARHGNLVFARNLCFQCPSLATAENSRGDTALHVAAKAGHADLCRFLIFNTDSSSYAQELPRKQNRECDFFIDDTDSSSYDQEMLRKQNRECDFFIDDTDSSSYDQEMLRKQNRECDFFIDNADSSSYDQEMLRKQNREGNTALHEAVRFGHTSVVQQLTIDPYLACLVNNAGLSPLYLAVEEGFVDIISHILRTCESSSLDDSTVYGRRGDRTPLHAAVIGENSVIMKVLLKAKPSLIKEADVHGSTPLHHAAFLGMLKMVQELLLSDSSTAYLADKGGQSPLHKAASNGHTGVVSELLRHCPDSSELLDARGRNFLHVAVEGDWVDLVRYILHWRRHDVLEDVINEADNDGNTPLHLATARRNVSIMYILLEDERVDVRATNCNRMTALDIAESDTDLSLKLRKILICTALRKVGATRGEHQLTIGENAQNALQQAKPRMDSYKAMAKVILVVAVLITTISFSVAFTMPGGYNSEGSDQGMATLTSKIAFKAFMIADAIALFSSISVALLLIWAGIGDQDLLVGTVSLSTRLMVVSLASLSLAFLAGVWCVVSRWLGIAIVIVFFGCFSLTLLFLYYQFSLILLPFAWRPPIRSHHHQLTKTIEFTPYPFFNTRLLHISPNNRISAYPQEQA